MQCTRGGYQVPAGTYLLPPEGGGRGAPGTCGYVPVTTRRGWQGLLCCYSLVSSVEKFARGDHRRGEMWHERILTKSTRVINRDPDWSIKNVTKGRTRRTVYSVPVVIATMNRPCKLRFWASQITFHAHFPNSSNIFMMERPGYCLLLSSHFFLTKKYKGKTSLLINRKNLS